MDFSHLEKMGRELKCPICLSLLKSAATLACNHVFCNLCIVESMKSASNCPVCKLPFQRREVRPALHMDNLVSIYKSMEAASGLTIYSSQVAPQKNSEELQVDDDKNASKTIMMPNKISRGKKSSKGKRKKMEKFDSQTSDPCPTRPSFSSSKRIHVTPFPVSETPIHQKRASKSGISTNEALDRSELENNDTPTYSRQEDPTLPPFFWLREANEEDEIVEGITPEIASLGTPKNAPCFSDIKDSDDDGTPKKATPISKSVAQEAFDSEMFEWTQRACSPELFSTPLKQIAGGKKFNGCNENKCKEISHGLNTHSESPKTCHLHKSAKTTRTIYSRKETLKKRCKQNNDKKSIYEMTRISLNEDNPFGSNEIAHESRQEKESSKKLGHLRSTKKINKKSCKLAILHPKNCMTRRLREINKLADVHRVISGKSPKKLQKQDIESTSKTFSEFCPSKSKEIVAVEENKPPKNTKKAKFESRKQSKRVSLDPTELKTPDTNHHGNPVKDKTRSHELGKANYRLQLLYFKQNVGENSDTRNFRIAPKAKTDDRKRDEQGWLDKEKVDKLAPLNCQKEQHTSTSNDTKEDSQPFLDLQNDYATSRTKKLLHSTTNEVLRKCKNVHPPVRCAFCHSSNNLEVTGEMMHYFNGKLVSSDYNGVNVIHCHKSCTEWAPDAFFKDDLVINLSTELARSRRIKCSCCGIKGAALGCFEKSCHRSFHYPCAKQTPECRWDNENFVMLCPLHSLSKFPSETSELPKLKRKKSGSKREAPPTSHSIDAVEGSKWAWPSGLPCKWVLCSSALSDAEKEILSEFASLTRIPVSKTWSTIITHVIASTNEDGACKRTLKFLMGIIEGKWILNIYWIKACMKSKRPVDEEKYEISVDVYGIRNGPLLGRMRIVNKEPKIFSSFWFYFSGDFVASYKGYLHDLITKAGGKVLQRRPISTQLKKLPNESSDKTFIVYSLELPGNKHNLVGSVFENRKAESLALAEDCGAKVVTNSWVLDSIAASVLQILPS